MVDGSLLATGSIDRCGGLLVDFNRAGGELSYKEKKTLCKKYRIEKEEIILIDSFVIPIEGGWIVDKDPLSENVLIMQGQDVPFQYLSQWYLFNLESRETRRLGRAHKFGLFVSEGLYRTISAYRVN